MDIRPHTAIIQDYDAVSVHCKNTGKPLCLARNGKPDLVVMSVSAFEYRENMLNLREQLIASEEAIARGEKGHTIDESVAIIKEAIERKE